MSDEEIEREVGLPDHNAIEDNLSRNDWVRGPDLDADNLNHHALRSKISASNRLGAIRNTPNRPIELL